MGCSIVPTPEVGTATMLLLVIVGGMAFVACSFCKVLEDPFVQNVFARGVVRYVHGGAVSIFRTKTVNVSCAEWHISYNK
jgi:hypothetical protein